jgi:catechol 2,3-dioxygenase-like lactoylglutathione lyase family enzyme
VEHVIAGLLKDFEQGKMTRRQLIQSLALSVTAASAAGAAPVAAAVAPTTGGKGFRATTVNHISYQVADYGRTRDFYADLLGMGVKNDDGRQCYLTFGDTFIIPRKPRQDGAQTPHVDHIAITIENFDKQAVFEELKRRGLEPREDQESYHVKDPDGFDLQISSKEMKA